MKELTKEQIEKAKNVGLNAAFDSGKRGHEFYLEYLRAAAPYLQMPADMVTAEEIDRIMCGVTILKASHQGMRAIIDDLLSRRNAQLLPKEEDPRRAKLKQLLSKAFSDEEVKEILAHFVAVAVPK